VTVTCLHEPRTDHMTFGPFILLGALTAIAI
jgi:hypothetical protein